MLKGPPKKVFSLGLPDKEQVSLTFSPSWGDLKEGITY
jgi:hypothetical protein